MADYSTLNIFRNCRFVVNCEKFQGDTTYFSEVSGFDATYDTLEYRAGDDPNMSTMKFPGLIKYGDITLKRGVTSDTYFFNWLKECRAGAVQKISSMTISLLDNEGVTPVATWEIRNVWPSKYEGPSFNGQSAEIAFETITLCHEGLERTL